MSVLCGQHPKPFMELSCDIGGRRRTGPPSCPRNPFLILHYKGSGEAAPQGPAAVRVESHCHSHRLIDRHKLSELGATWAHLIHLPPLVTKKGVLSPTAKDGGRAPDPHAGPLRGDLIDSAAALMISSLAHLVFLQRAGRWRCELISQGPTCPRSREIRGQGPCLPGEGSMIDEQQPDLCLLPRLGLITGWPC